MLHNFSSPNSNLYQAVLRKHHSTETALLHVIDGFRKICATVHAAALVTLDLLFPIILTLIFSLIG